MSLWEVVRVVVTLAAAPIVPHRALPALPPLPAPMVESEATACIAPFFYSVDGIKRYAMECLGSGGDSANAMIPDCTVPYTLDEMGRHHYIAACMDAVEAPCDVPFTFDEDGTKHYKEACLTD